MGYLTFGSRMRSRALIKFSRSFELHSIRGKRCDSLFSKKDVEASDVPGSISKELTSLWK